MIASCSGRLLRTRQMKSVFCERCRLELKTGYLGFRGVMFVYSKLSVQSFIFISRRPRNIVTDLWIFSRSTNTSRPQILSTFYARFGYRVRSTNDKHICFGVMKEATASKSKLGARCGITTEPVFRKLSAENNPYRHQRLPCHMCSAGMPHGWIFWRPQL